MFDFFISFTANTHKSIMVKTYNLPPPERCHGAESETQNLRNIPKNYYKTLVSE